MVRTKQRYILAEVNYAKSIRKKKFIESEIISAILKSVYNNFGDYGRGIVGKLSIKYTNEDISVVIIRCNRASLKIVWSSMSLITNIESTDVAFRVLHVAGTIKSVNKIFLDFRSKQIMKHELFILGGINEKSFKNLFGFNITETHHDDICSRELAQNNDE